MSLAGRLALVTGGGSGIGRATCLALAAQGAHIAIVDVNQEGAEQTRRGIKESPAAAGTKRRVLYHTIIRPAFARKLTLFSVGSFHILVVVSYYSRFELTFLFYFSHSLPLSLRFRLL